MVAGWQAEHAICIGWFTTIIVVMECFRKSVKGYQCNVAGGESKKHSVVEPVVPGPGLSFLNQADTTVDEKTLLFWHLSHHWHEHRLCNLCLCVHFIIDI